MSKLEKLNARLDKLSNLLDAIDEDRKKVSQQERVLLSNVLKKYFNPEGDDIVEISHSSVSIRTKGADKYNDFLSIYADDSWDENDSKVYTKLYISNSSFRTDEMSEWIVERFEKQAHYSRIAVDFQDDILAEMNQISNDANKKVRDIYKPAQELRKEYRKVFEDIQAIEKAARLDALMSKEGLKIEGVEKERWGDIHLEFPDLQVKFDWTLRNIRGLRIDRVSASGKSADITVKMKRWDYNKQEEVIADEKIERVRMQNINNFLNLNNISV